MNLFIHIDLHKYESVHNWRESDGLDTLPRPGKRFQQLLAVIHSSSKTSCSSVIYWDLCGQKTLEIEAEWILAGRQNYMQICRCILMAFVKQQISK